MTRGRIFPGGFRAAGSVLLVAGAEVHPSGTRQETYFLLQALCRLLLDDEIPASLVVPASAADLRHLLEAPAAADAGPEVVVYVAEGPDDPQCALELNGGAEASVADVGTWRLAPGRIIVWAACHAERVFRAVAAGQEGGAPAAFVGLSGEVDTAAVLLYLPLLLRHFCFGPALWRRSLARAHERAREETRDILRIASGPAIDMMKAPAPGLCYLTYPFPLWRWIKRRRDDPGAARSWTLFVEIAFALSRPAIAAFFVIVSLAAYSAATMDPAIDPPEALQRRPEGKRPARIPLDGKGPVDLSVDDLDLEVEQPFWFRYYCCHVELVPDGADLGRPIVTTEACACSLPGRAPLRVHLHEALAERASGARALGPYRLTYRLGQRALLVPFHEVHTGDADARITLIAPRAAASQ